MQKKLRTDRLLRKGLSGWEAGLLVFEDRWLEARNLPGFLSEADINSLLAGLKSQQDIQDFNTLMRLLRTVDHIQRQAETAIFLACRSLERMYGIGVRYEATMMAKISLRRLPLIVTQKQLEDLKAEQREALLKRYYCLGQVISWRAYAQTSEEIKEEWEVEDIEEGAPELYRKAEAEIADMIGRGVLPKPEKLAIPANCEEVRDEIRTDIAFWPGCDDWTPEQAENYLQQYFSGQSLYQAGLPEWKEHIDTFHPDCLDRKYWLSDDGPPEHVAVIQESSGLGIDSKGYFAMDFLKRWPLAVPGFKQGKDDTKLREVLTEEAELARTALERVKIMRQVLGEVSQVIGLAVHEWLDFMIDSVLEPSLNRYSFFATESGIKQRHRSEEMVEETQDLAVEVSFGDLLAQYDLDLHLPPLRFEKLRISAKEIADVRSWISESLGADWWKKTSPDKPQRSLMPEELKERWQKLKEGGDNAD